MACIETSDAQSGEGRLKFPFNLHPSVDAYKLPYRDYLQEHPFFEIVGPRPTNVAISWMIVGALTFHPVSNPPRILLIQRSAKDSMPHRWEVPGGGCDESDESILHSVARELKEEAGLVPRIIGPAIGQGYIFHLGPGSVTRKLNFIVELETPAGVSEDDTDAVNVTLDPDEHQAFVWATEEEVLLGRVNELDIAFTSQAQKDVVLDAFEIRGQGEGQREHDPVN